MGKKIKKAVRNVTKPVEKAVKKTVNVGEDIVKSVGKPVEDVVKKTVNVGEDIVKSVGKAGEAIVKGTVGAITGAGKGKTTIVNEAPAAVQATPAPPPAQPVEPPKPEDASGEDDAQTEAGRKKARAGGKKSLSVARSSGGGINI